jgi:glycosyltransferase involved in cell wall biosynthesis
MHAQQRRSVLSITSEIPWPLDTGGRIRTYHLQNALAQAFDLTVVVPVAPDQTKRIEGLSSSHIKFVPVPVKPRNRISESVRAIHSCLTREPYVLYRRHARKQVFQKVGEVVKALHPDVIFLDHLDSYLFRHLANGARVVMDLHNIYSLIASRYAFEQHNLLARSYFQSEARLLSAVERKSLQSVHLAFTVSQQEAAYFRKCGGRSVSVVPNGVDCSRYADLPCGRSQAKPILLFLGTMSWKPNTHAASYLIHKVFPQVRQHCPEAELWIVGHDPPANIRMHNGNQGIRVTGSVSDTKPYLQEAKTLLVPLDSGGGTRLKILEAFAAGLPVISTAIGAEGIEAQPGKHLTISPREEFADTIVKFFINPHQIDAMTVPARFLVQQQYDWPNIGRKAVADVLSLVDQTK